MHIFCIACLCMSAAFFAVGLVTQKKVNYVSAKYPSEWKDPDSIPDHFDGQIVIWDGEDRDCCSDRMLTFDRNGKRVVILNNKVILKWHPLPEIPTNDKG